MIFIYVSKSEKKYHFIYKTTCLVTKKYYIGMHSTDNLDDGYMGSGKAIQYSIHVYGKKNHKVEILEFAENREELALKESKIVDKSKVLDGKCLNMKPGGIGGFMKKAKNKKSKSKVKKKKQIKTRPKRKG